jgi:mono/diheme cytochrome c family protein
VVAGPSLVLLVGSVLAMLFLPHPVPRAATRVQRLYLANCATCHGADGKGSWRATIFLMRPGNLADPRIIDSLTGEYLTALIKNGGAPLGKPGMPAFGYHLSDEDVRELIAYLRTMAHRPATPRRDGRPRRRAQNGGAGRGTGSRATGSS